MSDSAPVTDDAFLGGALQILQPQTAAYRAGLDAVLLAAAAPVRAGRQERVLDAGAGVGAVGLCVARRVPDAHVALAEIEPELIALARDNVARNNLQDRVTVVECDISRGGAAVSASRGIAPGTFAHVLANPPCLVAGRGTRPRQALKASAHMMEEGLLETWARFLVAATAADGTVTLIHRADALADVLAALSARFGALKVVPVFPRQGAPATRILVQGIKGSRAPLAIRPGLVLHEAGGGFRPELEGILRHGAALEL
jgi:tRNA1(Val) A37 N6-methylase TrmN6